ncbi:MAG: hypothetical protein M3252_08660 [Actinomycetota bacterium]|nr:hypothetical protein [Actinomycetota bacterium]
MKRLGKVLLVGGSAFAITATAVTSWTILTGGPANDQQKAAGSVDVAGGLAAGAHPDEGLGRIPGVPGRAGHTARAGDDRADGAARGQDHGQTAATSGAPQTGGTPTTVSYGPFLLPPAPPAPSAAGQRVGGARLGESHLNLLLYNVPKPCQDCFITSLRPDLVDPDGRSANLDTGVMLHHAVWFQSGRPDTTCGPDTLVGRVGQRFFATGNERTGGRFVPGFGYHVGDSSWALIVELMNHTDQPKTVNLTLEVTWRPSSADMEPLTPVWLDVDNCRDSEYSAPAGPSRAQWRWTSTLRGRVISAAGHLHDGGIQTVLANLGTKRDICTSAAGYGRNAAYRGSIESMSACNWDAIGTVREGEVLALDAYYDLPSARDDVMGIMVAYVYETADLLGGTPRPPQPAPEPSPSPRRHEH